MFSYSAYGLGIRSVLPLPELEARGATSDVAVCLRGAEPISPQESAPGYFVRATGTEAYLSWRDVGRFLVRDGREVIVEPAAGVEERVLRLFLLGAVLAVLLHQRGRLVLHGSAVAVDGKAAVFLGGPGWGKSTLAAALYARGHGILADDVTAVDADAASPMVFPGFPQLKLWPEAAAALGDRPETLLRIHPLLEKRALRAGDGFPEAPLPLSRIYVLGEGENQEIDPLRPQEALVELVRHSYCARLLNGHDARRHFLHCASVAARVPVCRLRRQRALHALPALLQVVEEDLAAPIS